ncbi:hypothetical protein [Methanobrevibacter sp.]
MKLKYLIIVSFTLVILTMGLVGATEDVNASDTLTANDQIEEEIVLQQDSDAQPQGIDESLSVESEKNPIAEIFITDEVSIDNEYDFVLSVSDRGYLDGIVTIVVDDSDVYTKVFDSSQETYCHNFGVDFFKKTPSFGYHKINATYQKNGFSTSINKVKNVDFRYTFSWQYYDYEGEEFQVGDNFYASFYLPSGVNGTVDFKFNSKNYTFSIVNGEGGLMVSTKGFKVGDYVLEAQFKDASNYYPLQTEKVDIRIIPRIHFPYDMSIGEKECISITAHKNSKITAILYRDNGYKSIKITKVSGNTKVIIPLEKLIVKGSNSLVLECIIDGFKYYEHFTVYGHVNQKNAKSSIAKKGDKVTLNFNGPKSKNGFSIYLDDKFVKTVKATKGKLKYKFPALDIGKHKIQIYHYGGYFYSKTFWVTVKATDKVSLSLKNVNVKKSSKKLVLKATLKLNKKAKKGLKVTFKFNGKKYTAKTDKGGVAKVTIKKNILKKLKRGKKVKYSVNYSFKTVSRTVKVGK